MNKKEEDTTSVDVEEETTTAEEEDSEETQEEQSEESTSQFDYDAEIEAEKQRGKPDPAKAKEAFERRKEKRETLDSDEDDDERPLTRRELLEVLQQQQSVIVKETQSDKIAAIAKDLSESDKEAQYIIEIHKNRTFPTTLSLREQLEECHAIATRKKLLATNSELARALKGKVGVSTNSATTHRDPQRGTPPKLDPADEASYKRAGFTYDSKDRLYKKKLANGKTLVKDPKTKKSYIQ